MRRNTKEITLFGHTIPKEVYEDYENIEKIKNKLIALLEHSTEFTEQDKQVFKKLLISMSEKFHKMASQHESKIIPPSPRSGL